MALAKAGSLTTSCHFETILDIGYWDGLNQLIWIRQWIGLDFSFSYSIITQCTWIYGLLLYGFFVGPSGMWESNGSL